LDAGDVGMELALGERIRRLRKSALMTQDDLAAAAEVSTDLIRKLEQGRRHTASIGSLYRIARALGVGIATLLGSPGRSYLLGRTNVKSGPSVMRSPAWTTYSASLTALTSPT
jgi:transcriptional regulator with XRE-family HTH domain